MFPDHLAGTFGKFGQTGQKGGGAGSHNRPLRPEEKPQIAVGQRRLIAVRMTDDVGQIANCRGATVPRRVTVPRQVSNLPHGTRRQARPSADPHGRLNR